MPHSSLRPFCFFVLSLLLGAVGASVRAAEPAAQAIISQGKTDPGSSKTQKPQGEALDQERSGLKTYQRAVREVDTLKRYNTHLQKVIDSQKKEKSSYKQQMKDLAVTRRELVPLMYRMLDSLTAFVRLDLPFLVTERQTRLNRLQDMMVQATVDDAEKYRRILEAYQIESEFGHTIEAYRADLKTNNESRLVDFLRLGRVALYYQTLDGSETGVWDRNEKAWTILPAEYRKPVRDGLRIARKQASPTLLTLPVPAPEDAQ